MKKYFLIFLTILGAVTLGALFMIFTGAIKVSTPLFPGQSTLIKPFDLLKGRAAGGFGDIASKYIDVKFIPFGAFGD